MSLGVEYQYDQEAEEYQRARNQLEKFFSRFEDVPVNQPVSVKAAEIIAELTRRVVQLTIFPILTLLLPVFAGI